MKKYRIGTRKSPLALIQAEEVKKKLQSYSTEACFEIFSMKSEGDIIKGDLAQYGGKALFCSNLNKALLNNQLDLVVHSHKDMEPVEDNNLRTFFILPAGSISDVLITEKNTSNPDELKLTVGTSSPRRTAQIKRKFPYARIEPIRGNLMTRLEKLSQGTYGALILAEAGLERQNLLGEIEKRGFKITPLCLEDFLPSAGQGIIAVQCRASDIDLCQLLSKLQIRTVFQRATVEKAFLRTFSGNCHTAIGVYAYVSKADICLRIAYYLENNSIHHKRTFSFNKHEGNIKEMVKEIHAKLVN